MTILTTPAALTVLDTSPPAFLLSSQPLPSPGLPPHSSQQCHTLPVWGLLLMLVLLHTEMCPCPFSTSVEPSPSSGGCTELLTMLDTFFVSRDATSWLS